MFLVRGPFYLQSVPCSLDVWVLVCLRLALTCTWVGHFNHGWSLILPLCCLPAADPVDWMGTAELNARLGCSAVMPRTYWQLDRDDRPSCTSRLLYCHDQDICRQIGETMSLDLYVLSGVLMALAIACVCFCKTLVLKPIVLDGSD